jgi:hypothetical protein
MSVGFFSTGAIKLSRLQRVMRFPRTIPPAISSRLAALWATDRTFPTLFAKQVHKSAASSRAISPPTWPVIQVTNFEFAINLKTAKAQGLTFPPSFHLRATEVIE